MIASDAFVLGLGLALVVVGLGGAAWIIRWELRAQLRARRHGGFLVGGDR